MFSLVVVVVWLLDVSELLIRQSVSAVLTSNWNNLTEWSMVLLHCSEELLRHQPYAIKNQLVASKALWGFRTQNTPY